VVTAVLNRPTLVLNRNWQPVGVATVAKSLVKVWNETALIIDPDDRRGRIVLNPFHANDVLISGKSLGDSSRP
jgi:hypothetical protein